MLYTKDVKYQSDFTLSRSRFVRVKKPFAVNTQMLEDQTSIHSNTIIFTRFILNICKHVEKCLNPPEKREIIRCARKKRKIDEKGKKA